MGTVVASESLGGVMDNTLALTARDVGSIPTQSTILSIFISIMVTESGCTKLFCHCLKLVVSVGSKFSAKKKGAPAE